MYMYYVQYASMSLSLLIFISTVIVFAFFTPTPTSTSTVPNWIVPELHRHTHTHIQRFYSGGPEIVINRNCSTCSIKRRRAVPKISPHFVLDEVLFLCILYSTLYLHSLSSFDSFTLSPLPLVDRINSCVEICILFIYTSFMLYSFCSDCC